ncbi:MAG: hypothetical protein OEV30_10900 [Ignavibacteria bacterium]|nr:hypothetical protein [Ignavibacteria bacterium]
MPTTTDYLKTLTVASRLDFGPHGFIQELSALARAWKALVEGGVADMDRLQSMFRSATPAGRIYAALLMALADPPLGARALDELSKDKTEVLVMYHRSCVRESLSVSECVSRLKTGSLSGDDHVADAVTRALSSMPDDPNEI